MLKLGEITESRKHRALIITKRRIMLENEWPPFLHPARAFYFLLSTRFLRSLNTELPQILEQDVGVSSNVIYYSMTIVQPIVSNFDL